MPGKDGFVGGGGTPGDGRPTPTTQSAAALEKRIQQLESNWRKLLARVKALESV